MQCLVVVVVGFFNVRLDFLLNSFNKATEYLVYVSGWDRQNS